MRQAQPSGERVLLRALWDQWCRVLPPLQTIQVEDGVPEAMGVALEALQRRGHARFYDEADSGEPSLQWRLGSQSIAARFVEWLNGEGSA